MPRLLTSTAAALLLLGGCQNPSALDRLGAGAGSAGSGSGSAVHAEVRPPVALPTPHATTLTPDRVHLDAPAIKLPFEESARLLDAGKGARAPLRYQLAAGTRSYLTDTALATRRLDGAAAAPHQLPTIRDGLAITVDAGQPGRLAIRALPGELRDGKDAEGDAYLATWKRLLEGRRLTLALDPRGALGAIAFGDDPADTRSEPARGELRQRLYATVVPLPLEPVGVGAHWQVVTVLRQGPLVVKQTADYTLTARTAARWTIQAHILRVGEEQQVDDPSLPAGATAELLALFRLLEGTLEVEPTAPLPVAGVLTIESRLHVRLTLPGQPPAEQVLEDLGKATLGVQ
jgi:hypothetical protein